MCENAAQFVVKCFSEITVDSFSYHSALGKAMVPKKMGCAHTE